MTFELPVIHLASGHGVIEWYEPVEKDISYLPEVRAEIRDAANRLGHEASFRLSAAKHRTGESHIEVVHRKQASEFGPGSDLDSYVMLVATDEGKQGHSRDEFGWPAAMSIEMGAKNGGGGLGPLRGAVEALAKGVNQR